MGKHTERIVPWAGGGAGRTVRGSNECLPQPISKGQVVPIMVEKSKDRMALIPLPSLL